MAIYQQASGKLAQKLTSQRRSNILNTIQRVVSFSIYNDIALLLAPCCIPTVDFGTFSCTGTDGVYGIKFSNVIIIDTALAGKTCQVYFSAPEYPDAGVINTITFDKNGMWTGNLQSSFEGAFQPSPVIVTVTVTLIANGYNVIHQSVPVALSMPNCD
jgi:hypothetical protein